jgi:hypothetical protein
VERMYRIVIAGVVQSLRHARRQRLVDEELHDSLRQGRPAGRPRDGLARA